MKGTRIIAGVTHANKQHITNKLKNLTHTQLASLSSIYEGFATLMPYSITNRDLYIKALVDVLKEDLDVLRDDIELVCGVNKY